MKTGLIDVGGGFRGTYGAGVMDYFMDTDINFDYAIGVSAGSANIANYLAGQRGRCMVYYTEYGNRKEAASLANYIKYHNYINLDYLYGTLANEGGENPLDFPALMKNPTDFTIVTTDAETGNYHYFTKADLKQDDYSPLMASSSLPVVGSPYIVDGRPYFDGGMSDPVPIQKAIDDGCDKVVLVLTMPRDMRISDDKDTYFSKLLKMHYPECAKRLEVRYKEYNYGVELAQYYEKQGRAIILAPDDIGEMDTISRSEEGMYNLYNKGYNDAEAVIDFLGKDNLRRRKQKPSI